MQYKIIVDKQPSSNPSNEKKEYIVEIEELRVKGDVYDSLNIEMDRTYVTRRLSLSEYGVLSVLDTPVIEELEDVDIKLFEGDNYIYLMDMQGNKFYAEYLIKNDFNDIYVNKNEMNSSIQQTAQSIELSVNQKLTGYSTTQEMNSAIQQSAQSINLSVNEKLEDYSTTQEMNSAITVKANEITSSVSKSYATKTELNTAKSEIKQTTDSITSTVSTKVGKNEVISRINQSAEAVQINANKISLDGKQINLTGDNISIKSTNFSVDKNGNMNCNSANLNDLNIDGGRINLNTENKYVGQDVFKIVDGNDNYYKVNATRAWFHNAAANKDALYFQNANTAAIILRNSDGNTTTIYGHSITTPSVTQTSLESIKKNINKFNKNATNIINNSDIYEYNLKSDEDTDKKLIGFIIGDKYRTPDEVISRDGQAVGLYSAIGILWKAVQELSARVEQLEKEVQDE